MASFSGKTAINAGGTVVFKASYDTGGSGIFTAPATGGGTVTPLVDSSGPLASFNNDPSINDAGTVAFLGTRDDSFKSVYTVTSGGQVSMRTPGNWSSGFSTDPGRTTPINNVGQVVFRSSSGLHLSTGDGGWPLGLFIPGILGGSLGLNDAGQLIGHVITNIPPERRFHRYDGAGNWEQLPGPVDFYNVADAPALNEEGDAAASVRRGTSLWRLLAGSDLTTTVLESGDDLFGQPAEMLRLEDFNNQGQLLFWYGPAAGQGPSGLALATPVPEPTTVAVCVVAAAGLAASRRRRRHRGK